MHQNIQESNRVAVADEAEGLVDQQSGAFARLFRAAVLVGAAISSAKVHGDDSPLGTELKAARPNDAPVPQVLSGLPDLTDADSLELVKIGHIKGYGRTDWDSDKALTDYAVAKVRSSGNAQIPYVLDAMNTAYKDFLNGKSKSFEPDRVRQEAIKRYEDHFPMANLRGINPPKPYALEASGKATLGTVANMMLKIPDGKVVGPSSAAVYMEALSTRRFDRDLLERAGDIFLDGKTL